MNGKRNIILPGNLRYQPRQMQEWFGYDNLYQSMARVEVATLQVLGDIGIIPADEFEGFNSSLIAELLAIPTSEVDRIEREITHHDVRAWVRKAQEVISGRLARWVHVPLTSYDALDTGRSLQFYQAFTEALKLSIIEVVNIFSELVRKFANQLQIGRTHGQHALPITVGFWLATILNRILFNWQQMEYFASGLLGKISGAVGAHNAQLGLMFNSKCDDKSFEERVLEKVGIKPAKISTQIIPPEPLAYFLYSCCMMSASLAQFGRDCRHLMRSEIAEVAESFEEGQVGSSTMAHKRNPISFENLEGMWIRTKNEFGKVLDTTISEHQRDLVGSCVARDYAIIVINLQQQLNTLLRKNNNGVEFLRRISIDADNCQRNFARSSKLILAEPIYIALQMAGFQGDAHEFVNHKLVPCVLDEDISLVDALERYALNDDNVESAINNIPEDIWELLHHPEGYTGDAVEKALEIAELADFRVNS